MMRALLGLLLQTLGELSGVSGGCHLDSEAQIDGMLQQRSADSFSGYVHLLLWGGIIGFLDLPQDRALQISHFGQSASLQSILRVANTSAGTLPRQLCESFQIVWN